MSPAYMTQLLHGKPQSILSESCALLVAGDEKQAVDLGMTRIVASICLRNKPVSVPVRSR